MARWVQQGRDYDTVRISLRYNSCGSLYHITRLSELNQMVCYDMNAMYDV